MGKLLAKLKRHIRLCVQIGFAVVTNGYVKGVAEGRIYTGAAKTVCLPGLNCYSCPGALGSCPIGSLQAVASSPKFSASLYVLGLLVIFGAVMGRFVCGWLCPFGLVQELIYKIPFVKKLKKLPGDRGLKYLKYAVLGILVIALPALVYDEFGFGLPWFCKYVCPSGSLMAGIPLTVINPPLAAATGGLFWWKIGLLVFLLALSLAVWRPFCRYLCPLGAIYGFFNPIAAYRYRVDADKCISCGLCKKACKLDITTYKNPNSMECVRCGECIRACPTGAITSTFKKRRTNKKSG